MEINIGGRKREIKINRRLGIIILVIGIIGLGAGLVYISRPMPPTPPATNQTPIPTEKITQLPTIPPTETIAPLPTTTPTLITPSTAKEREELIGAYYNPLINELFLDKFDTGLNQWFGEKVSLGKMIGTQPEGQGLLTGDHVLILNSTDLETEAKKNIPKELKSGLLRFESYSRARPEHHWYDLDWFSINIGNHRIRWINSYNGKVDGEDTETLDMVDGGFAGEWQYDIGDSTNPIWVTFGKQELTCNCAHVGDSDPRNHLARKYSPLYLRMDIDLDTNEYIEFQSNDKIWKFNNIKPAQKTIPKDIGFSIKPRYTNLTWFAIDSVFLSTNSTNMGINKIKFNPIPRRSSLFQPLDHIYSFDYFDKGLRGWSPIGLSTYEGSYVYNDTYKGLPVLTGVPLQKDIWPIKRLSWLFPNNVKWEMILALENVNELRLVSDTQMGVAQYILDKDSFKRRFFEWRWTNKTWYVVDRGHLIKSKMDFQLIKIGEQELPQDEFIYISAEYNLKTGTFTKFRSMNKTWDINFYNPNYADGEKWYLENLINFGWLAKFNSPNGKIHVESTVISGN